MRTSDRSKTACILFLAASLCGFAPPALAGDTAGVGFSIRADTTAKDLGLPIYPGAVPRKDKRDDRSALTLDAWGGDKLFRIAVLKLTSPAPLDRIAGFYREALGRYGDVLDCSKADPATSRRSNDDVLTCDDKDVRSDALLYKVGMPGRQHLVKLTDNGGSVQIDLARIDTGA